LCESLSTELAHIITDKPDFVPDDDIYIHINVAYFKGLHLIVGDVPKMMFLKCFESIHNK